MFRKKMLTGDKNKIVKNYTGGIVTNRKNDKMQIKMCEESKMFVVFELAYMWFS